MKSHGTITGIDEPSRSQGASQPASVERPLSSGELRAQNCIHSGTAAVSQHNRHAGFTPAYKNLTTGRAVVSCFADGRPAPVHVLDGLPDDWVASRDEQGCVRQVLATVVAGFVRNGNFYTREAAAQVLADETPV